MAAPRAWASPAAPALCPQTSQTARSGQAQSCEGRAAQGFPPPTASQCQQKSSLAVRAIQDPYEDYLANATSEGFDLAFEWRASAHLDFSGAYGYNNPKFSANATSPNGAVVIYAKDTSIPDAGAPSTLSLSGEYHGSLGSAQQAYLRLDYTHTSEWRRTGQTDPASQGYDPLLTPIPAYGVLNLRLGSRFQGYDVSFFVNNLTDAAPALERTHSTFYDSQDWQNVTLRPRTYGLTLTWHK